MGKPTFIPHDYQRDIIEFIHKRERCAVWAGMGTGKTATTLLALDYLSAVDDNIFPVLVIAPLRVALSTWPDEVAKWENFSHLKVVPITGTLAQRERALRLKADIYTTNYENLLWLAQQGLDHWPFRTVVADEFTRLKSFRLRGGSKRAGALREYAHRDIQRFIGLTGTPSPNGLTDLWGQTWFLDRGARLGRSFSAFEDRWFTTGWDGYSLEPKGHAQKEIEDLLSDICLTVKGLPVNEPIHNVIEVDMPPSARKLYDQMEDEMFVALGEEGVEAVNAATKTGKLLQMANGAVYLDEEAAKVGSAARWQEIHRKKLEALTSVIEEAAGTPVLVAYHFKHDLTRLMKLFPEGRALDANPQTIKDWNAGKIPILFAHPACLHPDTEVLTEARGWVRIVDVKADERVFDGVEFVAHKGCSFSGVRPVIERFGITMTPGHKLLVNGVWRRAVDVRDTEGTRREARYAYAGDDPYLGAMLPVWGGAEDPEAECGSGEPGRADALPGVPGGGISPDDRNAVLVDLGRYERPDGGGKPRGDYAEAGCRVNPGSGRRRLACVDISKKPQAAAVYDLVDCGPRHRFLIRNAQGEVFISHNSAGHGLNLAAGGNILCFFSVNWSLEEHMQIIERIGPMRQKQGGFDRPVFVHYILARNTVDQLVMERLRSKRSLQEILLEALDKRKAVAA